LENEKEINQFFFKFDQNCTLEKRIHFCLCTVMRKLVPVFFSQLVFVVVISRTFVAFFWENTIESTSFVLLIYANIT